MSCKILTYPLQVQEHGGLPGTQFLVPQWLSAPPPGHMANPHTNSLQHPQAWPKPNPSTRPWRSSLPPRYISHPTPTWPFWSLNKTMPLFSLWFPLPYEVRPSSIPGDSKGLILSRLHVCGRCLCPSIWACGDLLKWGLFDTQRVGWIVATKDVSLQNRAISGKRVFVDIVKDIKVRSSRVRVTFNPTDRVLIRDEKGHRWEASWRWRQRWEGGGHKPKDPWSPKAGKGRKNPILEPLEGSQPCTTLILGVWSPGLGEDELLLF